MVGCGAAVSCWFAEEEGGLWERSTALPTVCASSLAPFSPASFIPGEEMVTKGSWAREWGTPEAQELGRGGACTRGAGDPCAVARP